MSDPRLCSVHLEAHPRRQDYRRAREALLGACGQQTLALDQAHVEESGALRTHNADDNPPPATAQFWLVDQDGIHNLKVGLNTIGRMPDNDVPVPDGSVSRRHCAILVHAGTGCEVQDFASKNGTLVNGRKISGPTRLQSGDEIQMCNQRLVFVSKADSEAGPGFQPTRMA